MAKRPRPGFIMDDIRADREQDQEVVAQSGKMRFRIKPNNDQRLPAVEGLAEICRMPHRTGRAGELFVVARCDAGIPIGKTSEDVQKRLAAHGLDVVADKSVKVVVVSLRNLEWYADV